MTERDRAAAALHCRPAMDRARIREVRQMLSILTDEQVAWLAAGTYAAINYHHPEAREVAGECLQRMGLAL